jgi:hypothetical protein
MADHPNALSSPPPIQPRRLTPSTITGLLALGVLSTLISCGSAARVVPDKGARHVPPPCPDTVVIPTGAHVDAPVPRLELIPPVKPIPPAGTYKVLMFISPTGSVDPSRLGIQPPFPREYDKVFRESVAKWRFYPAIYNGCAVRSMFQYSFQFAGGSR